jgi:hypothetical protein
MTSAHVVRWVGLAAAILGCSERVAAQGRDVAFEAGIRAGVGLPLGDMTGAGADLSDNVSVQIPLQLDVGVRLFSSLFLGGYVQYGFAIVADEYPTCSGTGAVEVDCSGHDVRLGIEAMYHFMPRGSLDPWIGLGFGYEWLTITNQSGSLEVSSTFSGFEFMDLQFGLDIALAKHFHLGPFLSFSLAQFSDASIECSGASACTAAGGLFGEIDDTALHEWLMLGVRGVFGS